MKDGIKCWVLSFGIAVIILAALAGLASVGFFFPKEAIIAVLSMIGGAVLLFTAERVHDSLSN